MTPSLSRFTLVALALLLAALTAYNLFAGLGVQQITQWDEARHIASALEMRHNHEWLVTYYQGEPDYWNVKPPLSVWLSALGQALVANPLIGLRLFSPLALLLTGWLVFMHARRLAGAEAGLLAATLLLTAWPLFTDHAARTADPDMPFIAFLSAALVLFAGERRLWIALGYGVLGLAFLTKSFHIVPYGLAAFIHTVLLWRRRRLTLAEVLLLPAAFLAPVLPWAVARYLHDGLRFFEVMLFFDVLKRTTAVIAGAAHVSPLHYLYQLLCGLGPALVAAGLALAVSRRGQAVRDSRLILPLLWVLIPLVTYMAATTRLGWYIYPALPALAVLVAVTLVRTLPALPRLAGLLVLSVLGLGLVLHETMIASCIQSSCFAHDPVVERLTELSQRLGKGAPAPVYLEVGQPIPMQHHYATALMLGNVVLTPGGRTAFEQVPPGGRAFLITRDNRILSTTAPAQPGLTPDHL